MQIKLIMYLDKIDLIVILIYIYTPYIQSIDHCLKTIWIVHEVQVNNLNIFFASQIHFCFLNFLLDSWQENSAFSKSTIFNN